MARLLIADDDRALVSLLEAALSPQGHEIVCAFNGDAAVALALDGKFDLILLDVMMPALDGYRASRKIHEALGENCPPILIMTARDVQLDGAARASAHALAAIQKPFTVPEIREKIRAALERPGG